MGIWNTLFPLVLNMSLTGSIAIVSVMAVRLFLRRMPRIFSYFLWAVVLLRLLCPVSFSSILSVFRMADVTVTGGGMMVYMPQANLPMNLSGQIASVPEVAGQDNAPAGSKFTNTKNDRESGAKNTGTPPDIRAVCGVLWLTGAAALWIYGIISVMRLRKKLAGAVAEEKNIYLCDYIGTAFVMGILRPRIYLPTTLSPEERRYILYHEQTHIRRGDHIFRLLAFLALSVHWFNPLVWCAFYLSERDMEMSCDEAVMRKMGTDLRAAYSASLLNLASGKKVFAALPPGFGEGDVKCRIKNIMHYRKTAVFIALPVFVLVAVILIALGSNPSEDDSGDGNVSGNILSENVIPENDSAENNTEEQQEGSSEGINSLQEPETQPLPEGVERIPVTPPVITNETILGADGPSLDYADAGMLVFHDYFGLFVYDISQSEIIGAVDLKAIGCNFTQGDAYCEVMVSSDGRVVYLHPLDITDMYIYNIAEKTLARQKYDVEGVEMFSRLKKTSDCVSPDYTVWRSENCVSLMGGYFLYLESGSGMAEDIYYIMELDQERVRFAKIFDLPAQEEEPGIFTYMEYTGYLDECRNWDGYERFVKQDYDGDGTFDRVYRDSGAGTYRIDFGNGDVISTKMMGNGFPQVSTCDLDGDGSREILIELTYGFSTDPNAFGEVAMFEKKDGSYRPLMPPEELCVSEERVNIVTRRTDSYLHFNPRADEERGVDAITGGAEYYQPFITLIREETGKGASMPEDVSDTGRKKRRVRIRAEGLTGTAALDETVELNDYMTEMYNAEDLKTDNKPICYNTDILSGNGHDFLEFHFEALGKWSNDEIVVTAVYENGALRVSESRYVKGDE